MKLAERRFIRLTILAWVLIYGLFLAQMLSAELPRGANWQILAFGVVFIALAAGLATAVVFAVPARIIMNLMLKDRRRSHRSETIALTILLVLIVAYIIEVSRERMSLAPPKGVATLSAFADAMPPPRRLELVRSDGRDFIAWTGDFSGPCDLPSGPSCYVFDDNGKLVDWQAETGDGGPVEKFLLSSVKQMELTLDEALEIAGNNPDSNSDAKVE